MFAKARNSRKAVALLLVIIVLTTLLIAATAFAVSMTYQEKSTVNFIAAQRAAMIADSVRSCAILKAMNALGDRDPTPLYDTESEFLVTQEDIAELKSYIGAAAEEIGGYDFVTSAVVADEQGKIDVGHANYLLLGNVMGSCVITEPVEEGYTRVYVDSTEMLDVEGGELYIGGEIARYDSFSSFYSSGYLSLEYPLEYPHGVGTLVVDLRAVAIFGGVYKTLDDIAERLRLVREEGFEAIGIEFKVEYDVELKFDTEWFKRIENVLTCHSEPYGTFGDRRNWRININTAPVEVLEAVFYGLAARRQAISDPSEYDFVTRDEAKGLAEFFARDYRIAEVALKNDLDLRAALESAYSEGLLSSAAERDAVFAALTGSGGGLANFSTARVRYDCSGFFSVEIGCSVNNPAGDRVHLLRFREVVSVATPEPVTFRYKTQEDFEYALKYGARRLTVTAPEHVNIWRNEYASAAEQGTGVQLEPLSKPAVVAVATKLEPRRGFYGPLNGEGRREGLNVEGAYYPFSSSDARFGRNGLWQRPHSFAAWIKPDSGGEFFILDVFNDSEQDDRLKMFYDGSELVVGMHDMTIGDNETQVRAEVDILPGRWYYFEAAWQNNKYGGMSMYLDGEPIGDYSLCTYLTADIELDSLGIPVEDASCFPGRSGVIMIDDEAIACWSITKPLITAYDTWGRGARGTRASRHYAGALVRYLGYSYPMRRYSMYGISVDTLYANDGVLAEKVGANWRTRIVRASAAELGMGIDTTPMDVDETQDYITVETVEGFQTEGYIKIGNEVIHYSGVRTIRTQLEADAINSRLPPGSPRINALALFTGCARGEFGTTAERHTAGRDVWSFSLKVSSNAEYPEICVLQIENEWLGWYQKHPDRPDMFVGVLEGARMAVPYRGQMSTNAAEHEAGEDVLQIFRIEGPRAGGGDVVTIIDSNSNRERRIIRRYFRGWTSFRRAVGRRYTVPARTRLLKFPSGENLRETPAEVALFSDNTGARALSGWVDDINFGGLRPNTVRSLGVAIGADDDEMILGVGEDAGVLMKIDREWIGVWKRGEATLTDPSGRTRTLTIAHLERGILGTQATAHHAQALCSFEGGARAGFIRDGAGAFDSEIYFRGANRFSGRGYLKVYSNVVYPSSYEIVGYTGKGNSSVTMPIDELGGPLYRGRFGTYASAFQEGDVAFQVPARYHHRYAPRSDDNSLAWFSMHLYGFRGVWADVSFEIDAPPCTRVVAVGRFGIPEREWEDIDGDGEDEEIWFVSPRWHEELSLEPAPDTIFDLNGGASFQVQHEDMEIRFYFDYTDGAWEQKWSGATPVIETVEINIHRPCRVLFRKELQQ